MQFIGYDSIKLIDLYFIAFNGAQYRSINTKEP